jgi:hypothetical protein
MKKLLALVAASLFVAGGAHAGLVTYSAAMAASTQTPFSQHLLLPKFNTAMGVLTGASFGLNGAIRQVFVVTNDEADEQAFHLSGGGTLGLTLPIGPQSITLTSQGDQTVAGGAVGDPMLLIALGAQTFNIAPADLLLFTGSDSLDIIVSATATSSVDGPGDFFWGVSTTALVDTTVTYRYDTSAVPEPGALALVGLALAAASVMTRRRQA